MEIKDFNIVSKEQSVITAAAERLINFDFDLQELFSLAFGYGTKQIKHKYKINTEDKSTPASIKYNITDVKSLDEATELTKSGTPIIFPITFCSGGYQKYDSNGKIIIEQMNEFRLPASTIVELDRNKAITTTPLSGGVGEVTEMYGFENWNISIKGICMPEPNHPQAKTPKDQKNMLYKFDCLADTIDIESEILRNLNIMSISIDSIKFSQLPGKPDFTPFEISCKSEEPAEIFGL